MDTTDTILQSLAPRAEAHLTRRIVPFWTSVPIDRKHGGFYGFVDNVNKPTVEADKGLVMSARYLWAFSALGAVFPNPEYRTLADHAYDYLLNSMHDAEHGGFVWFTDFRGRTTDGKKQVYGNAFAVYALCEYARAFGNADALRRAVEVYELLESRAKDPRFGGYWEACTADWTIIPSSALSGADIACAKSMNTHLHVLEAYTNLYRTAPDTPGLADAVRGLVRLHFERIVDPASNHLALYFDEDWARLPGAVSYGHDIEASWLLWEAIQVLGDTNLETEFRERTVALLDASLEGFRTARDGKTAYLANENHAGRIDETRIWWVQAETLVGLLNGWQMTGRDEFIRNIPAVFDYIETYQTCDLGDWYWALGGNDHPILEHPKAGAWKTPYHNSRACLEIMHRAAHA